MQFTAQLESLASMITFVKEAASQVGLHHNQICKIELATEEVLVNIISYAYPSSQKGPIFIETEAANKHFTIIIKDQGKPFNPTEVDINVPKDRPLQDRPIGGLGIYLTRRLMDEINYTYEKQENVLKLTVRF